MTEYDRTDKSENPRCNYCGSTDPADGFTVKTVIHRGEDRTGRTACVRTKFTVCKNTPCGGYLQMAYEG